MPSQPPAPPNRSVSPRGRLTYSNIMSTLAVGLVLMSGTAFAASQIGSADILNGSIASADLKNNSVSSADIKNGSVRSIDLDPRLIKEITAKSTGPQGPKGEKGDRGPRGVPGTPGVSGYAVVDKRFPLNASAFRANNLATRSFACPAGTVALSGGGSFAPVRGYRVNMPPTGWRVVSSRPRGSGWEVTFVKTDGRARATFLDAWAVCANKA